ncbi:MAG: CBS domain-containing protein [Candidatus Aenigmatarchaeota archaeon]|nr:CBS domain-containing protein [Candidatus Aenigmarchaeota archaeon]
MVMKIKVENVMTKKPLTVNKNEDVSTVAQKMVANRVGSIIVQDNGNPIGIITETDLVKKIVATSQDPKKLKAEDIMSSPLVFVKPDDDYSAAVEKMRKHKIKRIPVIQNGKVVGIVTTTDIARTVPEMIEILKERLSMKAAKPIIQNSIASGLCDVCGNYSDFLVFEDDQWICENCREE